MAERGQKRFTTRWVQSVVVKTRTDFTDPNVKGLVLRVTPNGAKSWAYLYRRKSDGRRRRVPLVSFPASGYRTPERRRAGIEHKWQAARIRPWSRVRHAGSRRSMNC
jgi:hypothetical protein